MKLFLLMLTVILMSLLSISAYAEGVPVLSGALGYGRIALELIGLFSMIATITPNKKDDKAAKWLLGLVSQQWLLDLINRLAMNFGNARNR